MTILGKEKGSLLDAAVQKFDSRVALELGNYCGYCAIRISSKMAKPISKLISIEVNSHNYAFGREMIEHAGKILCSCNISQSFCYLIVLKHNINMVIVLFWKKILSLSLLDL
jgi:hypothetical protein